MGQLNFTPEMEVFYMLFETSLSIFGRTSLKQHMEYFHFRCKIQLYLPVHEGAGCDQVGEKSPRAPRFQGLRTTVRGEGDFFFEAYLKRNEMKRLENLITFYKGG